MTATEKNKMDRNYKILKNNLNTLKKVRDICNKKKIIFIIFETNNKYKKRNHT